MEAKRLGFALCGVTACATPGRLAEFHEWLDAGYAGQMQYLENRRVAYADPNAVMEGCRTIVMLAMPYTLQSTRNRPRSETSQGKIARYAAFDVDYHDVIHQRLKQLRSWIMATEPEALVRGIVDTAPLLERDFGEAAGLGWIGKNTLLLNRQFGSYFFLAAILTSLPLVQDPQDSKNYCGTCTACLRACPTQAFPKPFVLDASRCISYLTIEHRDTVAPELAQQLDGWAFGCDVCQEVCPWNRKAEDTLVPEFSRETTGYSELDILGTLQLTQEDFRERFRRTPLWRSKRSGIIRNAILCAASAKLKATLPFLKRLTDDEEPVIRAAAAWAITQIE